MLNQLEIDNLMRSIQGGKTPEVYYVAHMVESREGVIDESQYKSISKFKVIKIKIENIVNAYLEYIKYVKTPELYHVETETEYYDVSGNEYIHYYTVPNGDSSYTKDLNPRIPSIIFGVRRKVGDKEYNDDSPIKAVFTNQLEYSDLKGNDITHQYQQKNLNWKYITLTNPEIVDGIEYKYVTSNWYILKTVNFPRTEYPLVNAKDKSAYFMKLEDALNFVKECES